MVEEYTLIRDIVYDHNERMLNIRKYYPFFKLMDTSFLQFKEGKYGGLDMGYILMAVLRFFIEENNFREKLVSYNEYAEFMGTVITRDFDYEFQTDEEQEDLRQIISYIFDKIKNEGKPFSYEYYDPENRKRKVIRVKIIDNKIVDEKVVYFITSDAIEFYLDTKEIKDESTITISQVLLEKMIANRNFKGGTEVVSRINNEVSRLIAKKNDILNILSFDVFEGIKAFDEFINVGAKWFEEEQKLFIKNKQLIEKALRAGEADNRYFEAMDDIYHLESELNRAMRKHSELLSACAKLQKTADDMIAQAKINRIRSAFDFNRFLTDMIRLNRPDILSWLVQPLFRPALKKQFSLINIDNLLTYRQDDGEKGELVELDDTNANYEFADEVEEERIFENYSFFVCELLKYIMIITRQQDDSFELRTFNEFLVKEGGEGALKNVDYYSFVVHLCQKNDYSIKESIDHPDTFLEQIMKEMWDNGILKEEQLVMKFHISFAGEEDVIEINENRVSNLFFSIITGCRLNKD